MSISSRTPEGVPNRCPICGADVRIEPSKPGGDAPCPRCGALLWFNVEGTAGNFAVDLGLFLCILIARIVFVAVPVVVIVSCFWYFGRADQLGLGPAELVIITLLGVLLFGRSLPEAGRFLGKLIVQRQAQ